jgi:hypothetical protein
MTNIHSIIIIYDIRRSLIALGTNEVFCSKLNNQGFEWRDFITHYHGMFLL